MTQLNQEISNPRTGQRMTFVEIRPDLLRIDSVNPPTSNASPCTSTPRPAGRSPVGLAGLRSRRRRAQAHPGRIRSRFPNARSRFWTDGTEDAVSVQFFEPALDTAAFFETLFALSARDLLDPTGMPRPLQLAVMVPEFSREIRPTRPPWPVLRTLAAALAPIARARGYRARIESEAPSS